MKRDSTEWKEVDKPPAKRPVKPIWGARDPDSTIVLQNVYAGAKRSLPFDTERLPPALRRRLNL